MVCALKNKGLVRKQLLVSCAVVSGWGKEGAHHALPVCSRSVQSQPPHSLLVENPVTLQISQAPGAFA